jgi:hypothetical protein
MVLLPVWHGVDQRWVAKHSPILADRKAITTARWNRQRYSGGPLSHQKDGFAIVARQLLARSLGPCLFNSWISCTFSPKHFGFHCLRVVVPVLIGGENTTGMMGFSAMRILHAQFA